MSAPPYTTALGLSASITRAGIWREVLEFVRLPLPLLRVGWGRFFDRNIWPDFRVFRIQRQPFLKPRLGVGLDRVDRALRLAHPAIDAFVRLDDEHVFALVEAVHGAHFDAVHSFAANATLVDDVGQLTVLSAGRSGELVELQQVSLPRYTVLANTEVQMRPTRSYSGQHVVEGVVHCGLLFRVERVHLNPPKQPAYCHIDRFEVLPFPPWRKVVAAPIRSKSVKVRFGHALENMHPHPSPLWLRSIAAHPVWRRGGRNPIASGTIQDPPLRPGKCGSSYQTNDG